MSQLNTTAYVGVPDFLRILLEKAEKNKVNLPNLKKAMFSGGPLFPNVADYFRSKDVYIFGAGGLEIQFRTFPAFQGEIIGKEAKHGKISG